MTFLHGKLFYKEKDYKYQQIYCKMVKEKMLNEGNQIHNFISSSCSGTLINYGSGSDFLTSYGSGSTRQKVTVPTVPVPQHWYKMHIKGGNKIRVQLHRSDSRSCFLVLVNNVGTETMCVRSFNYFSS